jgi:hypothetical protein
MMQVNFKTLRFTMKEAKGIKVYGVCWGWDDPHHPVFNNGNGERDGC